MNQSGKYLQQPGVLHVKRSTCYDTSEVLFHQNDGTEMKTNTRFFTNVQACKCDDNMAIESSSNKRGQLFHLFSTFKYIILAVNNKFRKYEENLS